MLRASPHTTEGGPPAAHKPGVRLSLRLSPPLATAVLLTLALAVGVFYFSGLYGSDDLQYVTGARSLLGLHPNAPTLGGARLTVVAPLALFMWLASGDALVASLGFVAIFAVLVFAVYAAGRRLLGQEEAFVAAFLAATSPLLFYYAGAILPDSILALALLAHLAPLSSLVTQARLGTLMQHGKQTALHAFGAGIGAGLCYATKEASVIFLVPSALYAVALLRGQNRAVVGRLLALAVAGVVSIVFLDSLVNWIWNGDAFVRLTYARDHDILQSAATYMIHDGHNPLARLTTFYRALTRIWPQGPLVLLAAIATISWRTWHQRTLFTEAHLLFFAAFWTWLYSLFGTLSLHEYIAVPIQARYLAPIIPPLLLVLALGIRDALRFIAERSRLGHNFALLGFLVLALLQVAQPSSGAGHIYRTSEVQAALRGATAARARYPQVPIYADLYLSTRVLPYGITPFVRPGRTLDPCSNSPPYIYLLRAPAVGEDPYLPVIRECATKRGHRVEDVTSLVAPDLWKTRLDALYASLGLFSIASHERAPRVQLLFITP